MFLSAHTNSCSSICVVFYTIVIISKIRTFSQRRIVNGKNITIEKRYMVYLIKAQHSKKLYDNWICGGAIVHPSFILTSAACVEDVTYMYAIAGYIKYINPTLFNIDDDECVQKSKKKIIFSCLPKHYNFSYERIEDWGYIDIAMVKVDTPYDFTTHISPNCSWIPNAINISYDWRDMEPGNDAMALGWGSTYIWRHDDDSDDYNQEQLQYSPVRIQRKSECKKYYARMPAMLKVIDKYMICTMESGNIDDEGHQIKKVKPSPIGCKKCLDDVNHVYAQQYRKNNENFNNNNSSNSTVFEEPLLATYGYNLPLHEIYNGSVHEPVRRQVNLGPTRRNGICQNDHGGPLITWVGTKEVVIGTASMFMIRNGSCVGPFLFTSTKCNGVFITCVMTKYIDDDTTDNDSQEYRRFNTPEWFEYGICDLPAEEVGFEIVQRRISWPDNLEKDNSPGAEEEPVEDLFERSQVPISELN